jgi:polyhydroxyalkanoate synthesis regulator phasin
MSEADADGPTGPETAGPSGAEAVGDALRNAVERTLTATAGSATETRDRAQGLLDDVVRRGQGARERVARRGEEATTRLAEAIGELRAADGEDLQQMAVRLTDVESRLRVLEAHVEGRTGAESNPQVEVESSLADRDDQRDSGA